jgi:hypothetical protein
MSVLAASIEADALSMYKDVYNQVNNIGAAATYKLLSDGAQDPGRQPHADGQDGDDDAEHAGQRRPGRRDEGLFQPSQILAEQMRDGSLGRTAGFEFFENTLLVKHTSGSDANGYTVNGANQTGAASRSRRRRHVQEGRHRHLRRLQPLPPGDEGGHRRAAAVRRDRGLRGRRGQHRDLARRSWWLARRRT